MSTVFKKLFFISLLVFLINPLNTANAQGTQVEDGSQSAAGELLDAAVGRPVDTTKFNVLPPNVQINIPGVNFSQAEELLQSEETREGEKTEFIHVPFLAEYIAGVYRYAIGVVGIIAVVMVVVAGFQWVISGGNQEAIGRAKKRITGAIVGLLLAVGSYTLLYNINPELVSFRSLKLNTVETEDLPVETIELVSEDIPDNTNWTPSNPNWRALPQITGVTYTGGSTREARADVVRAFQAAAQELVNNNIRFFVTSAGRSASYQYNLMQQLCGCPKQDQLPSNVNADGRSSSEWRKHCTRLSAPGSSCNAAWRSVRHVNEQLQTRDISHTGGNALDIAASTGSTVDCSSSSDPKVTGTRGTTRFTRNGQRVGGRLCIPKDQQIIISTMLKHGFCVGLRGQSNLREPWHFELTTNDLRRSTFCVDNSSNDQNLSRLGYVERN